jgi:hypothetical protein
LETGGVREPVRALEGGKPQKGPIPVSSGAHRFAKKAARHDIDREKSLARKRQRKERSTRLDSRLSEIKGRKKKKAT